MYKRAKKDFDKEAWLKGKEDKKQELLNELREGIKSFKENPERLAEFLNFQSKFYRYSINNTILIYRQNPHASFVGGYTTLNQIAKELAEQHPDEAGKAPYFGIKKGETAMTILSPVPIVWLDNNGEWVKLKEADEQLKRAYKAGQIESRTTMSFKPASVFDISQTNIPTEYYPSILKDAFGEASEKHKRLNDFLLKFCEEKGISVSTMDGESVTLRGYATPNNEIALNSRMNDTGLSSTLLHEMGHIYMHFDEEAKAFPSERKEVEADIFSILMSKRYDIDIPETRYEHLNDNYAAIEDEDGKQLEKMLSNAMKHYSRCVGEIEATVEPQIAEDIAVSEAQSFDMVMM